MSSQAAGHIRAIQRKREAALVKAEKAAPTPKLPADETSCGRVSYLSHDVAQRMGAVICTTCGLYHPPEAA